MPINPRYSRGTGKKIIVSPGKVSKTLSQKQSKNKRTRVFDKVVEMLV
jgi:hypothetical protein